MSNIAIDTAVRFGEIPFVEFTKELVTGVFDSLVEAHILQMEEYGEFLNVVSQDLSTYINNTIDDVTFDQISDFITKYELPTMDSTSLNTLLGKLQAPDTTEKPSAITTTPLTASPTDDQKNSNMWGSIISNIMPAINGLVDKIKDPNKIAGLNALTQYNNAIISGASTIPIPTYKNIQNSIAALIASNKYSLLQNMVKQGMLRLVVTEGEIETKVTFSTWNNNISGSETYDSVKTKNKFASNNFTGGGIVGLFKGKKSFSRNINKVITVNTAKSYQQDYSGTKVDIFGRVLIKFKTDYQPLNGF